VFGVERFGVRTELVDYAAGDGATIRFGGNGFGLAPTDGSRYVVRYRLGNGRLMNVAADTLVAMSGGFPAFVDAVGNPLAASGGRDPESASSIRTNAPQQFRAVTYRAVQPIDFEEIVERDLDWVQQAGAQMRWTGSWPTVFVTPDPLDEVGLGAAHRDEVERLIDRVRMAGREAKVLAPRYANIDLEIRVCVAPNAYRGEVKEAVLLALFGEDGNSGFFDPDHFTFGTPLSRAALIAAIQAVPGVRAVEGMRVRRRGWFGWRDFVEYTLPVGMDEVVRVANTRQLPERGAVKLVMEGGA
jgi:predicted phage baseplate assembly protein